MLERTLAMIKPDAVATGAVGPIVTMMEAGGLKVVAMKMTRLTRQRAEAFYLVHKERPFYQPLCTFMSSGPIVALVLEGENAIKRYRELMGATDSRKAAPGTIRHQHGTDNEKNAVHGSDSPETATVEISFHFSDAELRELAGA
jgi:nucleoside-diphosphate kinase